MNDEAKITQEPAISEAIVQEPVSKEEAEAISAAKSVEKELEPFYKDGKLDMDGAIQHYSAVSAYYGKTASVIAGLKDMLDRASSQK